MFMFQALMKNIDAQRKQFASVIETSQQNKPGQSANSKQLPVRVKKSIIQRRSRFHINRHLVFAANGYYVKDWRWQKTGDNEIYELDIYVRAYIKISPTGEVLQESISKPLRVEQEPSMDENVEEAVPLVRKFAWNITARFSKNSSKVKIKRISHLARDSFNVIETLTPPPWLRNKVAAEWESALNVNLKPRKKPKPKYKGEKNSNRSRFHRNKKPYQNYKG